MSSRPMGVAQPGSGVSGVGCRVSGLLGLVPLFRPAPPRSSAGCGTKFWRITSWMWPYSRCSSASASSDAIRSSGASPMPTRIPLVNGMRSSPAARIVSRRTAGCLVGDPWCTTRSGTSDSSISPWDAVTSRSRASSSRDAAPMLVCGSMPRSSARSHVQATYEMKSSCPYSPSRRATSAFTSGFSPVSTSSSFTPRRAASSSIFSTSSGAYRCGRCVANAQYLQ